MKAMKILNTSMISETLNENSNIDIERRNYYIEKLCKELEKFGFLLNKEGNLILLEDIRTVQVKLSKITNEKYKKLRKKVERYFAKDLSEIDPMNIKPRLELIPVNKNDKDTRKKRAIFNYAKSFWSIPVSTGFGRRMDYILWDDNVEKVIGIFGLCDPVIGLGVRDNFIGWNKEIKEERLYNIMTAYILGAVPPYNQILGAKLVALSAISKEVIEDFYKRYNNKKTLIKGRKKTPYLVAIDTLGAFGKSAIYNRLRGWKFVGYTKGQSHLHLTLNGVYEILIEVIEKFGNKDILKRYKFGEGPNYKFRVISEGLKILGLNKKKFTIHSIKRGYYFAPLAENWREFLLMRTEEPKFIANSLEDNFLYWKERWLSKRLKTMK